MKKKLIFLFVLLITSTLFTEEYEINIYSESIKSGNENHTIKLTTDNDGRIIKTIEDGIERIRDTKSDYGQRIIKKAESIPLFTNENGFNLVDTGYKRKYVYKNGIMYMYYNDVQNIPNDLIIERKYAYTKTEEGYVITSYECGETSPGLNLYIEDGKYTINKRFLHTGNESIDRWNHQVIYSAIGIVYGITAFIPMIFTDTDFSYNFDSYEAGSELIEGKTVYAAENLRTIEGLPWVSAKPNGLHDKITIKCLAREDLILAFYNGFQSRNKTYLYKQNSRVRKIKITYKEINKSVEFELRDIREKQLFDMQQLYFNEGEHATIEIEILSVYPGDKYSDLCLQAIIPEIK